MGARAVCTMVWWVVVVGKGNVLGASGELSGLHVGFGVSHHPMGSFGRWPARLGSLLVGGTVGARWEAVPWMGSRAVRQMLYR